MNSGKMFSTFGLGAVTTYFPDFGPSRGRGENELNREIESPSSEN